MITDFIFLLGHLVFSVFFPIVKAISDQFVSIIPNSIYTSIDTALSYLGYFNGIFPIDTFVACIGILATFYTAWYTFKIAVWVWSLLPYIGKDVTMPDGLGNLKRDYREARGVRKYGRNPNPGKEYKQSWRDLGY